MSRGLRRPSPALVIACLALFAVLGGTVQAARNAAKSKRIDGRAVRVKSLPGNRLAMGSVPGNRLAPGAIPGSRIEPGSITGAQIDAATLGQVPTAVHADHATTAKEAETAVFAISAQDAKTVNGYAAGCRAGTRPFAGACWQVKASETALNAPAAALSCATQGGELPGALELAAFSQQPEIALAADGEWSGDLTNVSGEGLFGVVTVSASAVINSSISTNQKKFRCVIPLVG